MVKLREMLPFRTALFGLALIILAGRGSAHDSGLSQTYCSNQNTGSDYSPGEYYGPPGSHYRTKRQSVYNIYNSGGSCFDQCKDEYAFAVVQNQDCWCSNYAPYETQDTGDCNQQCPGYPSNLCGNQDDGLYGYIALNKAPSGTLGAPSSTPAPPSSTVSLSIKPGHVR